MAGKHEFSCICWPPKSADAIASSPLSTPSATAMPGSPLSERPNDANNASSSESGREALPPPRSAAATACCRLVIKMRYFCRWLLMFCLVGAPGPCICIKWAIACGLAAWTPSVCTASQKRLCTSGSHTKRTFLSAPPSEPPPSSRIDAQEGLRESDGPALGDGTSGGSAASRRLPPVRRPRDERGLDDGSTSLDGLGCAAPRLAAAAAAAAVGPPSCGASSAKPSRRPLACSISGDGKASRSYPAAWGGKPIGGLVWCKPCHADAACAADARWWRWWRCPARACG
mmetsp:Transcript_59400/g.156418  ORF Transcript_59400/g.156418 Transcript_59400/m.156418 type:complete len:286 (-) Transcript_59400:1135-1992(-)